MRVLSILVCSLLMGVCPLSAQTYRHDASVMNQFTVGETGVGALTPDAYYAALHSRYRQNASETGKQSFRTQLLMVLRKEAPYAEAIDSIQLYRAEIEGLRIAERTPSMLDAAWAVEKEKIEKKQDLFWQNIEKISQYGGSPSLLAEWKEVYRSIECGLKEIREAYLPMSLRKKQYLEIYRDLVRQNHALCLQLGQLRDVGHLNEQIVKPDTVDAATVAREAYHRWRTVLTFQWESAGK